MDIAFIGLGAMGRPMARRLVEAQHRVTGFDLNAAALDELERAGGHRAASAKAAASGAEAIVMMVVNAEQAEAVLFEAKALEALKPDALVILMATCPPAKVKAIADRVTAAGRRFVDAPVSGGVVGAEAGTLTIMAAAACRFGYVLATRRAQHSRHCIRYCPPSGRSLDDSHAGHVTRPPHRAAKSPRGKDRPDREAALWPSPSR